MLFLCEIKTDIKIEKNGHLVEIWGSGSKLPLTEKHPGAMGNPDDDSFRPHWTSVQSWLIVHRFV
jgi:hypothetical protein